MKFFYEPLIKHFFEIEINNINHSMIIAFNYNIIKNSTKFAKQE